VEILPIILGVLAVVAVIALAGQWYQKKRTEAWKKAAEELGIRYLGPQNDVLVRCGQMKLFSRGRSRRVSNAISGDAGDVRITLGDYRYRTGSGKNSHTHSYTICVLESDRLDVPGCYLRPEVRFFDALGSLFGGQDIDFSEDPEFSKSYVLQGDNEAAVRKVFDEGVRSWFAARVGRRFHFEARGGTLVFHTGNRRQPAEARDLMQEALEIMNLLAKE
jgi:hypothetical protein